jgi:hypothetical protein
MQIHIVAERSVFSNISNSSLFIGRVKRFPIGNFLVSTVLITADNILISLGIL